ncbi:OLC1v1019906C1 [Oldenlandia corymbosa var. corymbosa]|uniref:OLC1v1019906C1 n=1 Tax=Oldenlandia corymbosa var. corymbosa TaxID=529605 RepID=A0AAV1EF42_OLDCO|nr:OLC1v1019906C1 [Oldenlandia corymbosa var. corymbosa]
MASETEQTGGGSREKASQAAVAAAGELFLDQADILTEVLLRLDVKSLCNCRCVCKAWKATIANPAFDKMHSERYNRRDYLLFEEKVFYGLPYGLSSIRYIIAEHNEVDMEVRATRLGGVVISDKYWTRGNLLAQDGGLVCFVSESKLIYLCNPQTGQTTFLPLEPFQSSSNSISILNAGLVFGYLSSKREYVIIVIGVSWKKMRSFRANGFVKSFRASKFCFDFDHGSSYSASWKEIKENCPYCVDEGGILVDNSAYWVAREKNKPIITLDLESDKFGLIGYPPGWDSRLLSNSNSVSARLIDLKGQLYLTDSFSYVRSGMIELWALIKTNESCWVKEHAIKLDFPVASVYPKSSSRGELIVESRANEDCVKKYYIVNPYKESARLVNPVEYTDDIYLVGFFRRNFF